MLRCLFAIIALFLAFSSNVEAASAKRVALIVGNESYKNLSSLNNPALDASTIAKVLGDHGFEVKLHKNLNYQQFEKAVADFVSFSQGTEEAVIFYAGHGMSVVEDGRIINVLAATDAVMDCRTRSARNVVALENVLSKLAHVPKKVALFDACRSDPLPQCSGFGFQAPKLTGNGDGVRSAAPNAQSTRGPVVEPTDTQSQLLIGYSSNLGETAQDGEPGRHSPYAKALLIELNSNPKMPFRELLDRTATRVTSLTGAQFPWVVTKGGEPQMCLAVGTCEGLGVVSDQRAIENARALARRSSAVLQDNDPVTAALIAIEALPNGSAKSARPYVAEAEAAVYQALAAQRELFVVEAPLSMYASEDHYGRFWIHHHPLATEGRQSKTRYPPAIATLATNPTIVDDGAGSVAEVEAINDRKELSISKRDDGLIIAKLGIDNESLFDPQVSVNGRHAAALASNNGQGDIIVWEVASKRVVLRTKIPKHYAKNLLLSPDGRLVFVIPDDQGVERDAYESTSYLWDISNGELAARISHGVDQVYSATFSENGRLLFTGGGDGKIFVWSTKSGQKLHTLNGASGSVRYLRYDPDKKKLVSLHLSLYATVPDPPESLKDAGSTSYRVWNIDGILAGDDAVSAPLPTAPTKSDVLYNTSLYIGADGTPVRLIQSKTKASSSLAAGLSRPDLSTVFPALSSVASSPRQWQMAAQSPDGNTLLAFQPDSAFVHVIDIPGNRPIAKLSGHVNWVKDARYSRDGRYIAVRAGEGTTTVWDAKTFEPIVKLGHQSSIGAYSGELRVLAFSADGRYALSGPKQVWDIRDRAQVASPPDVSWQAIDSSLSPDAALTVEIPEVSATVKAVYPGYVTIIKLDTGEFIRRIVTEPGVAVVEVNFAQDGRSISTLDADLKYRIYRIFPTTSDLVAYVQENVPRCLSTAQRKQFFLPEEVPAWCGSKAKWPFQTLGYGETAYKEAQQGGREQQ